MKRVCILALAAALATGASAQSQASAFEFLKLPVSSHAAALGGHSVSLSGEDIAFHTLNPAALDGLQSRTAGLQFMTWMQGTNVAGATYGQRLGARAAIGAAARYADYGVMDETDVTGQTTGTFSAKDISIGGTFSYRLTDRLTGGVTGHVIYSKYSYYTSVALGVDLGLQYRSKDGNVTAGLAALNLGGQVKTFEYEHEPMPTDVAAGVTWRLAHAPLRITLTACDLNHWSSSQFYSPDGDLAFKDILLRHFTLGTDILLTDQLYVAAGLNLRSRAELAAQGRRGLAGFSIGTGLQLKKTSFGLSLAKYQVSGSSLLFNFQLTI